MRDAIPCLFCGGDRSAPDHDAHCDGRQGLRESAIANREDAARAAALPAFEPLLIAGIVPATWDTSEAAAVGAVATKDQQRARVYDYIRSAGRQGRTDDEIQAALGLDGSSERPRRWELWQLQRITVLHDSEGREVKRTTRMNRRAVVWIACVTSAGSPKEDH